MLGMKGEVGSCSIFKNIKGDGDDLWFCLVLFFTCKNI